MEMTLDDVLKRADSYKFLSDCYYLPDDKLIKKIIDFSQKNHCFAELACHIRPAVELESLRIDFTRLFVGPFKLLAPPYGSVYLEDNRMLGESTIDVRNWYERESLDIVIKDAPDHIAMELEFMYYLVTKQIQAIEEENLQIIRLFQQKQKSFLCSHIARWLPQFAENVQKNAQTEFYKKLAKLTEMFIQSDTNTCTLLCTEQPDPMRA